MNIENFTGQALFSSGLGGAAAGGDAQGAVKGVPAGPEGSLFQQLISQMLSAKLRPTDMTGENCGEGAQGKEAGDGSLMSELMLASGNLAKVGLQYASMAAGDQETVSETEAVLPTSESGDPPEAVRMLLAGLTNGVPVSGMEQASQEAQTAISAAGRHVSAIGPPVAADAEPEARKNQQYIAGNSSPVKIPKSGAAPDVVNQTISSDGPMLTAENTAVQREGNIVPETAAAGSGKAQDAPAEAEPLKMASEPLKSTSEPLITAGSEPPVKTAGKQGFDAAVRSGISGVSADRQDAAGIPAQFEAAAADEHLKPEAAAEHMSQERVAIQNSVHGAAAAGETAMPGLTVRMTETAEPYRQIGNEILSKLEQNGPAEFKMRLEPEDLGQIDVKLRLSEGKLIIDILAANAKTQALLTSQVDRLIASIGLQNVQVESVQVGQQSNSQAQDTSQNQGYAMNSAMDFSQRKQQEQYQQGIFNSSNQPESSGLHRNEAQNESRANRIAAAGYDSHRMNYTV